MKKVLIGAAVLVVAAAAVAYWQGWIKIERTKTDDGKTHVGVAIDTEKYKQDKEKLKKLAGAKSKALKDRLAGLREKAKGLSGADKAKAEKEIDALTKQHEALEAKLKDIDGAAEDQFEGLKQGLTTALEGITDGPGKEAEKPQ
jgi:hypothetical protein